MATLDGPFNFRGKMGKLSAYKRKGSDKIILRVGSGPSKEQIHLAPQFERTRENNSEFKACTMLTAGIRGAVFPVKHLGDPNFTGALNKLGKRLQLLDPEAERGQRGVYLSRHKQMLRGFSFNLEDPFDSVVRHPPVVQTDRASAAATVTIPALVPGVSLVLPWKAPFLRFVVSLGAVGDVYFTDGMFQSVAVSNAQFQLTPWQHVNAQIEETAVSVQLRKGVDEGASLVLAIGIELGMPDRFGEMEWIQGAGAVKILAVF